MSRHLHVVDAETGEVIQGGCPACAELRARIEELEATLEQDEIEFRRFKATITKLKRNKLKEAQAEKHWPMAARLFVIWKRATRNSSPKSILTLDRYEQIRPFLKGATITDEISYEPDAGPPRNPLEECAAAIMGRATFPFTTKRENGTTRRFHEWGRIFKDSDEFAESRDRRPRDWRQRVEALDPGADESQPRLAGGTHDAGVDQPEHEKARQTRSQAV